MKCQILCFKKNKNNVINLSSAELVQIVVKVNGTENTILSDKIDKSCDFLFALLHTDSLL